MKILSSNEPISSRSDLITFLLNIVNHNTNRNSIQIKFISDIIQKLEEEMVLPPRVKPSIPVTTIEETKYKKDVSQLIIINLKLSTFIKTKEKERIYKEFIRIPSFNEIIHSRSELIVFLLKILKYNSEKSSSSDFQLIKDIKSKLER